MPSGLYRKNILIFLRYGFPPQQPSEAGFLETISIEIDKVAAHFGCEPEIVPMNLLQAQQEWDGDLDKLEIDESEEPDHLKQAGWLCHWLRKKRPISKLYYRDESKLANYFEDYYNEASAFIIGLKIAIFHECCERELTDEEIKNVLADYDFSDILHDISVFLSHKSVSPHAIYMIYKSLLHKSPFE